jgi:MFS family permease
VLLAGGLAWAGSLIHVQAAIDHVDEYWLYALFFIALASVQFVWGIALYRFPRRRLLVVGAVISLAVVGLWLLSRTVGLPIGPDRASPEPPGLLDVIATADEIGIAGLMVLLLHPPGQILRRGPLAAGVGFLRGSRPLPDRAQLVGPGGWHPRSLAVSR